MNLKLPPEPSQESQHIVKGKLLNAVLVTAWNDLLDYVGRGNLEIQARNTIPRFFYVEGQGRTIGNRIKAVLKQQDRTLVWLASQIPCTPNHLYKVYANATINTGLLQHISDILDYNFFEEYT